MRLADRYALVFVPVTLGMAGLAWLISGDPARALAVLVVATPCPLLLAAPIAIVAGISRAARRGIIVKGGGPLETLARARVLLFDKTGTLTAGRPRLASIETAEGEPDELLRLAAALEQASPHVLAASIVHAARKRDLTLPVPTEVVETAGAGVAGTVDGRVRGGRVRGVRLGRRWFADVGARTAPPGGAGGRDQRLHPHRRSDRRGARDGRPDPTRDTRARYAACVAPGSPGS